MLAYVRTFCEYVLCSNLATLSAALEYLSAPVCPRVARLSRTRPKRAGATHARESRARGGPWIYMYGTVRAFFDY